MMGNAPSAGVVLYHLSVSAISVTVAGWLYWKKGLETAIIAHILANIILMIAGSILI
jgi:membrane protease YdiL (CAAX protease family)